MSTKPFPSTWWGLVLCIGYASYFQHISLHVNAMSMGVLLPDELPVSTAQLNLSFIDPVSDKTVTETQYGRYGVISPIHHEYGKVVHVLTYDGYNHGCGPLVNVPSGRWIALIQRGECKFHHKVLNAIVHNASAVLVYNNVDESSYLVMEHFINSVVSVFIHKSDGERLADLVDSGVEVYMNITLQDVTVYDIRESVTGSDQEPYRIQPILIISVCLIGFLITGLSVLLVYGIRRAKMQRKKIHRPVVFTTNDSAIQRRLLLTDLPDTIIEPNNNDPNHNVYNAQCGRHQ